MKRRITSILVALCMVMALLPSFALTASAAIVETAPASGDGSASNPYKISSPGELAWFRTQVNSGRTTICAELTNDIDLSGDSNWTPTRYYQGVFDGKGHYIGI